MELRTEESRLKATTTPDEQETATSVINDFAQTTSLLGIQQILRKRSIAWLVAYVICVIMSIVQSWHMTNDFFEMKTSQKFTIQSKEVMPFPSVTVCSNIVLPAGFNYSLVPKYNHSVADFRRNICISKEHKDLWARTVYYNKLQILQYLRGLPVENRTSLGLDLRANFILRCRFAGKDCNLNDPLEVYFFNNPYYGNCFTFNPAYDETIAKYGDLSDKLSMEFELDPTGFWLIRSKKPFVGVLVHEPGTAPILDLPSVHDVYGGEYVMLTLELREKVFIKRTTAKKQSCVYVTEPEFRNRTRYFSPTTPFHYSLEACMRSCQQDHVGETCGLIDPTMPVQAAEYEKNRTTELPPLVCTVKQRLTMQVCNCPLPCDITTYDISVDHNELASADCEQEIAALQQSKSERVKVAVHFLSNIYECVEEELQHTLSEFLGFLGGNMSLWIGLCVISLLELCELAWKLARITCKPKWPVTPLQLPNSLSVHRRRSKAEQQLDQNATDVTVHFPGRKTSAVRSMREHRPNFRSIYDYSAMRNHTS